MQTDIIFSQILILSFLVLVGVIGAKTGIISCEVKDNLAKIIFNITLPLLLLCNFSKLAITSNLLINSLNVIVLTFLVLIFMLLMSILFSRLVRISQGESAIFKTHSVFGNLVYLGYPVISSLYGAEGLLYAGMYQLVSNLLMWTIGVMILNQKREFSLLNNMKYMLNPNTIAILIGFTMFLFSINLPTVIIKSLGALGDTTTQLSMLYLGSMIYHSNLKGLFNNREIYVLTANKLVIVPILIILIFSASQLFLPFKFDRIVISVLVILASMPAMANVVVMAKIFKADDQLATANVVVTTIISIITLPVVLLSLDFFLS